LPQHYSQLNNPKDDPLRPAHPVHSGPSSKSDLIAWLRANGWSWAAIRALFPGLFSDTPPSPA
jgi:hypothetical protein